MNWPVPPMLPSLTLNEPDTDTDEWLFEPKYDGFRAQAVLTGKRIDLYSRRLHVMTRQFPEIVSSLEVIQAALEEFPYVFDCELCILENHYRTDFTGIQTRFRLKNEEKILRAAKTAPATLMVFDLLSEGNSCLKKPLIERKQKLTQLFSAFPRLPSVRRVETYEDFRALWEKVQAAMAEGAVMKKRNSPYVSGRQTSWLKYKNFRHACFIITGFDPANSSFTLSLNAGGHLKEAGLVSTGFTNEEKEALKLLITKNGKQRTDGKWEIDEGICAEIKYIDWTGKYLRDVRFHQFLLDKSREDCTWEQLTEPKSIL